MREQNTQTPLRGVGCIPGGDDPTETFCWGERRNRFGFDNEESGRDVRRSSKEGEGRQEVLVKRAWEEQEE